MSNETCYILRQVENDLQELRGDLKTWLITQADEGTDYTMRENPFAYTVGARQMRFGDDFDHTRMARYDVSNVCCFKYIFATVCIGLLVEAFVLYTSKVKDFY